MRKIFTAILFALLIGAMLFTSSCKKAQSENEKYDSAVKLLEQGNKYEAAKLFYSIYGYSDAKEQFDKIAVTMPRKTVTTWPDGSKSEYKYDYKLDDKGRVIKLTKTEPDGKEYTYDYTYDDEKKTVTEKRDYEYYTCIYTYDDNGRTVRAESHDFEFTTTRIYTYTYDEKGSVIKRVESFEDGSYADTYEYFYDGSGRIVKRINTYSSGTVYTSEHTYDGKGNRIKTAESNSDGEAYVYEYFYDDNGNNIKSVYTYSDGVYTDESSDFIIIMKTCIMN